MTDADSSSPRREIAAVDTGYHMFGRRKVSLAIEGGALLLREDGVTRALGRAEIRPISWTGHGKIRPLVPLAGLALATPRGEWLVVANDMTIGLDGAQEQAGPHPHVFVGADELTRMAAVLGVSVIRKPAPAIAATDPRRMMWGFGALMVVSMAGTLYMLRSPQIRERDCASQAGPKQPQYPRLDCKAARAELDRVARQQAAPRSVVLRPMRLTVHADDVTGPATLQCDGIEFAVQDARVADPTGPIDYGEGPHSVLVTELASGALQVAQYSICSATVGSERAGK